MTIHIRRRKFLVTIGGAAAWPLAARAQQQKQRLVGVVAGFSEAEMHPPLAAFRSKLKQLGWTEGEGLVLDVRVGVGDYQRMTVEAGTLVSRNPDVIVTLGTPGLTAVRQHTHQVPVVFTLVADPVSTGLVKSLAHPGGHATGFTNFEFSIGAKWLELLKDLSPQLTHVTLIANPANPTAQPIAHVIEDAGPLISVETTTASVRDAADIEAAILRAARQHNSGVIVLPDSLAVVHSQSIIDLVQRHRLPTIYPFRTFAIKGGLLTYGLDVPEIYRQAAEYVDRILRGIKPSDLPVQAPNKFELVINLKTAKALGLDVPAQLQQRADEVIE